MPFQHVASSVAFALSSPEFLSVFPRISVTSLMAFVTYSFEIFGDIKPFSISFVSSIETMVRLRSYGSLAYFAYFEPSACFLCSSFKA